MGVHNFSRQRESIKSYLMSTKSHPTADTVYLRVKEDYPNISLGTVYRNLNLLVEMGEAIKITTPQGGDRFDGDISPHDHVVCNRCGKVVDLYLPDEAGKSVNEIASASYDGKIERHTRLFFGTCKECLEK